MQAWRSLPHLSATIRRKTCPFAVARPALEQPLTLQPLVTGCLTPTHAQSPRGDLADAKPRGQCAALGGGAGLGSLHFSRMHLHPISWQSYRSSTKSPLLNYRGQTKRVLKLCVSQVIRMWPKVSKLAAVKGTSSLANPLQGPVCGKPWNAALFFLLLDVMTSVLFKALTNHTAMARFIMQQ